MASSSSSSSTGELPIPSYLAIPSHKIKMATKNKPATERRDVVIKDITPADPSQWNSSALDLPPAKPQEPVFKTPELPKKTTQQRRRYDADNPPPSYPVRPYKRYEGKASTMDKFKILTPEDYFLVQQSKQGPATKPKSDPSLKIPCGAYLRDRYAKLTRESKKSTYSSYRSYGRHPVCSRAYEPDDEPPQLEQQQQPSTSYDPRDDPQYADYQPQDDQYDYDQQYDDGQYQYDDNHDEQQQYGDQEEYDDQPQYDDEQEYDDQSQYDDQGYDYQEQYEYQDQGEYNDDQQYEPIPHNHQSTSQRPEPPQFPIVSQEMPQGIFRKPVRIMTDQPIDLSSLVFVGMAKVPAHMLQKPNSRQPFFQLEPYQADVPGYYLPENKTIQFKKWNREDVCNWVRQFLTEGDIEETIKILMDGDFDGEMLPVIVDEGESVAHDVKMDLEHFNIIRDQAIAVIEEFKRQNPTS